MLDPARLEELKAAGHLPSPRGVALEVIRLTQDVRVTNAQLARAIQTDPALTGKMLKAANSPVLGLRRPAVSVQDAMLLLGVSMVRQLTLSFSLVADYRSGRCASFDYQRYWQDSLLAAVAAHALAVQTQITSPDEVFVLGLLGQVGRLTLATVYPEQYDELLRRKDIMGMQQLNRAEQQSFETTHAEITASLLQDWGLPRPLVAAVAAFEDPEYGNLPPNSREHRIAQVLNLAWKVVHALQKTSGAAPEQLRKQHSALIFDAACLGITTEHFSLLVDKVIPEWQQWSSIFEVPAYEVNAIAPVVEPIAAAADLPAAGQPSSLRVLVADDDPSVILLVSRLLTDAGHLVAVARNGREALEQAFKFQPDILVTDWMMPEMNGMQLVKALRETRPGQGIYILLLTGQEDEEKLIEAFDTGIDDYVVKPVVPRVLRARMRAGERFVRQRLAQAHDLEEIRRFAAELAVNNRRLQQAVMTDPLTGLPNRRYALERLEQEMATARRRAGPLSLVMLDVDHFKKVNDTYGHDVGDEVLRHVSGLLRAKARLQDAICRMGGEEFLIICPDTDRDAVARCGERLRSTLETTPFIRGDLRICVTASLGLVTAAQDLSSADLVRYADQAVYRAKAQGRNQCVMGN